MKIVGFVAALAIAVVSSPVHANVINGDFQTGDFAGWDFAPDSTGATIVETSFAPTFVAEFDGPLSMSQTISTTAGQQYLITFSLFGESLCDVNIPGGCVRGGAPNGVHVTSINTPDLNDLTATFGDGFSFVDNLDVLDDGPPTNTVPGGVFEFTGVASGNLTTLTFLFDSNIDPTAGAYPLTMSDISVAEFNDAPKSFFDLNPNPFTIPEPASGSILGAALLGLLLRRRSLVKRELASNARSKAS